MPEKLLLQCQLYPLRIATPTKKNPNSTKLLTWNLVLPMNPFRRNAIHKDFTKSYTDIIKKEFNKKAWGHEANMKYIISIGFFSGKAERSNRKTGRFDISNFGYYLKMAEDVAVKVTSIPEDDHQYVIESRCKYLGEAERESLHFQITCVTPETT